jgi:prevent-host-death family protein
MRTLSATEISRNFSHVLDSLEHGGDEIVIMRNKHPVARLIPGTPRMTALEAFGDLYRTLDDAEGQAWLADIEKGDRMLVAETRDPWA